MNRRVLRVLCTLWLLAGSLIPGSGWALCVSANGHVAFEVTAAPPPAAPAHEDVCREECPPERCEDCHDVQLASLERACPRRDDASAPVLALAPAVAVLPRELPLADPARARVSLARWAYAAPHLVHVLRR